MSMFRNELTPMKLLKPRGGYVFSIIVRLFHIRFRHNMQQYPVYFIL